MAIQQQILEYEWIQQGAAPNCGSCCMASIVNYSINRRGDLRQRMGHNEYVGLAVAGIRNLGSVSSRIAQYIRNDHQGALTVAEVKVAGRRTHWGGLVNKATGGEWHRPEVTPNDQYFLGHERFLLREYSAMVVAGHFIIQTGADEFWDPNLDYWQLPLNRVQIQQRGLAERADALQIDVNP